ncbi:MFS transporter [Streptomyces flavofungini]|uniref:MFS transporter n=1 Tax=Streptomyces flavofungini TaxID=68200 RepID=A0ABS0X3D3_9ACTN|nr:MFS transporter [Streptomyces flavofungini]MBJ3807702.1 MFS transporter [Streptomyces flavofungini]GHC63860.1 MFS transporter [Streptomyces flavofungini]
MTTTIGRVLRDRNAGLCLGAVVVSGFGSSALTLVAGIWVKELTGSDGLAALCTLALWAPLLLGPLLGTLADRTRRRPLLVAVNVGLGVLLLSLLRVDGAAELWLLFAVLVVYGACGVVTDAAEAALVAGAVAKDLLGDLNGLRMSANEGMKLLAPLAGAGVFAAWGGPRVALLDAVTFVLAGGMFALLRVSEVRPARDPEGWRAGAARGARLLWGTARLRPLVVAGGLTMLSAGVSGALVYAIVDALGRSPAYTSTLYVAQGAGSVAAGIASGALLRRVGERRFAGGGIALTALSAVLLAQPWDALVLAGGLVNGVGLPCVLVAALTAVQREAPPELLGRVAATASTLMFAPTAAGIALGAALVELVDHRLPLYAVAGARLLIAAPLLRSVAGGATARRPSA